MDVIDGRLVEDTQQTNEYHVIYTDDEQSFPILQQLSTTIFRSLTVVVRFVESSHVTIPKIMKVRSDVSKYFYAVVFVVVVSCVIGYIISYFMFLLMIVDRIEGVNKKNILWRFPTALTISENELRAHIASATSRHWALLLFRVITFVRV